MKLDEVETPRPRINRKRKACVEGTCATVIFAKKRSQRRCVHFAEEKNQTYDGVARSEREMAESWYSKKEIATFQQQTLRIVASWLKDDKTAQTLQVIFRAFQSIQSQRELQNFLESKQICLTEHNVGLEVFALHACAPKEAKKNTRRHQILQQIHYFQRAHFLTGDERADDICRAISMESRASCMYARFVAHVAAGLF